MFHRFADSREKPLATAFYIFEESLAQALLAREMFLGDFRPRDLTPLWILKMAKQGQAMSPKSPDFAEAAPNVRIPANFGYGNTERRCP